MGCTSIDEVAIMVLPIRAAYAVLSDPSLVSQWNAIDAKVTTQVQNALESDKLRKPVCC